MDYEITENGKPHPLAHVPTPLLRQQVEAMAGLGIRQNDMLKIIGLGSKATLEKHYREELDTGMSKARVKVMETLYKMATSGNEYKATRYWLEVQGGEHWRPAQKVELSGQIGTGYEFTIIVDGPDLDAEPEALTP